MVSKFVIFRILPHFMKKGGNMENLQKLAQVYNTLTNIETKGQGTILMGACLTAMKEIIEDMQSKEQLKEDKDGE